MAAAGLLAIVVTIVVTIVMARVIFALPPHQAESTTALPPATEGRLAESVADEASRHPGLSGVVPLPDGASAFAARLLLADAASTSIDAQYYIWHDDLTGYLLLKRLQRAADRGVRVRLLLDDNGTASLDSELAALHAHPNVEVRLWNPFNLRTLKVLSYGFDFFRLNRRMHNKSFTVDNRVSILGGRNVGDEYFGTGPAALFVDLDVLTVGTIVPEISNDFDRYWNSQSAYPADRIVAAGESPDPVGEGLERFRGSEQMSHYRDVVQASELFERLTAGRLDFEWTRTTLVSDDPAKGLGAVPRKDLLTGHLEEALGEVSHRFDGVTPYFVPGGEGVKAFTRLEKRGVAVRMLTNSMAATDVLPVHAGYAKRRDDLLAAGVELFELRPAATPAGPSDILGPFGSSAASLHAKTFAVDGDRIFVGSFNFDPRSARLNTEMGLLIHSERMADGLHRFFDNGLAGQAWKVENRGGRMVWVDASDPNAAPLEREPGSNSWKNAAITVVGWLPVEWLL